MAADGGARRDRLAPGAHRCRPRSGPRGRLRREPTQLRRSVLDATNWHVQLAIRFGVILRKVWGGSRIWGGARAQAVLLSVWRTCWQQERSALEFLSQLLRGMPVALALPP